MADPAGLRAGYEALREAVLSGCAGGWRHGQGMLTSRGMAAWIATCSALASAEAGTTADPAHPSVRSPSCPPAHADPPKALSFLPQAGQIVAVLAQMALAHA